MNLKTKRMNILEVVESCNAGVGRHVRGLCEGLISGGHRVTVAYSDHRIDDAFRRFISDRQEEIRFIPLGVRRKVSPVSDLRSIIRLMRLIKSEGPFDLVHGHSSKGGAIARIAGRWFGIPTVYTPHSLIMASPEISRAEAAVYTLIERSLGCWATSRIIAVSEEERQFILELGLVPDKRIDLIENGIDERDFECLSERETLHEDVDGEHPLTFGALMRFSSQKAPGHLVEAFSRLAAALPQIPIQLVIAGDGELLPEVRRQVEACGLGEKVSLPGWEADTRKVLSGFDIYVLSSLYEGGPYTIMEAMAASLPVITTDVFGTRETVARSPGNILVARGNPEALADGMREMATLDGPDSLRHRLREIGRANHGYARIHFRQSETTRRTFEVYRALRWPDRAGDGPVGDRWGR